MVCVFAAAREACLCPIMVLPKASHQRKQDIHRSLNESLAGPVQLLCLGFTDSHFTSFVFLTGIKPLGSVSVLIKQEHSFCFLFSCMVIRSKSQHKYSNIRRESFYNTRNCYIIQGFEEMNNSNSNNIIIRCGTLVFCVCQIYRCTRNEQKTKVPEKTSV